MYTEARFTRGEGYARPVWLALLEKQVPFELIPVNLGGEQFEPEFLALNPFYLDAQYPDRSLLPNDAKALAVVRMVQSVEFSELLPSVIRLIVFDRDTPDWTIAFGQVLKVLAFFESLLADGPFFAGEHLTIAEIVAGTLVPVLPNLGISLGHYPKLKSWCFPKSGNGDGEKSIVPVHRNEELVFNDRVRTVAGCDHAFFSLD